MELLVEYNKEWNKQYRAQAKEIKRLLGKSCVALYHIGATATPGMPARPIIDVLAILKDTSAAQKLTESGYTAEQDGNVYTLPGEDISFCVYCVTADDKDAIDTHLGLLNYFLGDNKNTKAFAEKKREIAAQHTDDPEGYAQAKKALLDEIAPIAREQKRRSEKASTYMAIGMCLGCGVGMCFGVAFDNIGIGMCIGMSVGMCLGLALGHFKDKKSE